MKERSWVALAAALSVLMKINWNNTGLRIIYSLSSSLNSALKVQVSKQHSSQISITMEICDLYHPHPPKKNNV